MANNLSIPVSVTDGFTAPLAKLRNQMQQVSKTSGIKTLNADWKRVEGSVVNVSKEVASLTPIFQGLGIASLSFGTAIATAAIGVRNFALGARDMSLFGRETGVTVEKLRTLEAIGRRYGVTADQVRSNAQGAADNFDQIRRRIGGLYQDLRSRGEFNLAESLVGSKDVNEYIDKVLDGASRISNPKRRQDFLRNAFGTDDFSKIIADLGPKWRAQFDAVQQRIGTMPAGAEQAAAKFNEAMDRMADAMEKVRVNSMGPLLETSAKLIETWEKPVGGALLTFLRDAKDLLDGLNAAGKAWQSGDYLGFGKALNGGKPIVSLAPNAYGAPLAGSQGKADAAASDRLSALKQRLDKLNESIDGGRFSAGAREGVIAQRDKLQDEIKRLTDELVKLREQGATIQKQSFGGSGFGGGGLIQSAAFGGVDGGLGGGGAFGGMKAWADFRRSARQNVDAANSAAIQSGAVNTPRGEGRGTRGAARTGQMMAWAMDQLRREGIPEEHLRTAAAHLVGQAQMESGLDPNKSHDGGTGFGIYGARDPTPGKGRRTDMFRWLDANGYARNSAEGQMREMAHRAASGRWGPTRNILFGKGTGNLEIDTNTITRDFERPKIVNRRSHAVANALRIRPDQTVVAGNGFSGDVYAKEKNQNYPFPWDQRFRAGDEMMQRAARAAGGLQNPAKVEGSARLTIDINGLPSPNYRARTSMDGMFKDVKLHAGKTQMTSEGFDI